MEDLDKAYGLFERLLDEERIYMSPDLSFRDICALMKVDRRRLDAMITRETGMSGDELLKEWRMQESERLKEEYGISLIFY